MVFVQYFEAIWMTPAEQPRNAKRTRGEQETTTTTTTADIQHRPRKINCVSTLWLK